MRRRRLGFLGERDVGLQQLHSGVVFISKIITRLYTYKADAPAVPLTRRGNVSFAARVVNVSKPGVSIRN